MRANLEEDGKIIARNIEVTVTSGKPNPQTRKVPADDCRFKISSSVHVNIIARHRLIFNNNTVRTLNIDEISGDHTTGTVTRQIIEGTLGSSKMVKK
ncbi:MAG: hypothetical protein QNJ97_11555 [Myxococcota bacterium]|nr:hypothetical protein [Myxococcota bacterium]